MKAKRFVELPVPGSGYGDIRILFNENDILAEFEYRLTGVDWIGCIHFSNVVAFRFRDELRSAGFCLESYGAVVQMEESDWISQLKHGEPPNKKFLDTGKHYAVFFSNNGYFEVIAEGIQLQAPRTGLLNQ